MRASETLSISVLVVALLAGTAVGAAAQDEEQAGSTHFTGTILHDGTTVQAESDTVVDGVVQFRGGRWEAITVEATDPRITGTLTLAVNGDIHNVGDLGEDVELQRATWRIENDDGAWSGNSDGLVYGGPTVPPEEAMSLHTLLLTGEDAYEGLTAYLLADWTQDSIVIEGAVIAGEAPPLPEAPPAG